MYLRRSIVNKDVKKTIIGGRDKETRRKFQLGGRRHLKIVFYEDASGQLQIFNYDFNWRSRTRDKKKISERQKELVKETKMVEKWIPMNKYSTILTSKW